jgi:hypothetical protein
MAAGRRARAGARAAFTRLCALLLVLLLTALPTPASAADRAQIIGTQEQGFGRLVLSFPDRMDLPKYSIKFDNGVLAIEFDQPVSVLLPDLAVALPDYASVARVDPDGRGIRIGLRTSFNLDRIEAGDMLFIDLLPTSWQGLPPGLPPEVVASLSERAKEAARNAEQKRKAEEAKTLHPAATVRVGRNPTFVRVQFDWNVDTEGKFALDGKAGTITFDWPVPVDLYQLKSDLPAQIVDVANSVGPDGSKVVLKLADGVAPRFYAIDRRSFVMDVDIPVADGLKAAVAAEEARKAAADASSSAPAAPQAAGDGAVPDAERADSGPVVPTVAAVGSTIRIDFPFAEDTAAAVFRRGDTVWMLFDTDRQISAPAKSEMLDKVASGFTVVPAEGTKVVRLDLSGDRLATLGSEGRSWVLSLGDVLLNPTEPMALDRHRDADGQFEMTANLDRPGKLHAFHDPDVGDVLDVVTVFPPARGVARSLDYVDFDALRTIHGLVVRPKNATVKVELQDKVALIEADGGLTLSPFEHGRVLDGSASPAERGSYIDFSVNREDDPAVLVETREALISKAAEAEGRLKELARLDLAQFYLSNQFSYEAIGVLDVLQGELKSEDLGKKVKLTRAIADTLANRPADALSILNGEAFSEEADALLWRAIAKTEANDFAGARLDAIGAENVADAYPSWIELKFLFAGVRAAVETKDEPLAQRLIKRIEFSKLDPEQVTTYQLMQGRIAELDGRDDEAIDTYGQVIAADVRPTRAEAVYRTLLLLRKNGTIDLDKATQTLAAEALLWRGGPLETDMDKLLAELEFQNGDYRAGFDTVKQAVAFSPESSEINELLAEAQTQFEKLFLDGVADALDPVHALSLYYDFRALTPPGIRGDEMIRNLAQRLVKVDLLTQAADLLEYQIGSRLTGMAKAQVAADLALIRIADRDPEGALRALNESRLADMPPSLERRRRIVEARALIDAGRQALALDLISKLDGRDVDLLRIDAYWSLKNYGQAAELLEVMYAPAGDQQMTEGQRMNILKAAVGFVFADDRIGLSRLRSKFGEQMANSAEWPMFEFVTGEIVPQTVAFRKVAREVSGMDSLEAFLKAYRDTYAADDSLTPDKVAPPAA